MSDFVEEIGDEINKQVVATSTASLGARARAAAAAAKTPPPPGTSPPAAATAAATAAAAALTAAVKGGCRVCVRHGLTGKLEPREIKRYFCSMAFHPMSAEAAITDFERHVEFVTAYKVTKSINRSQAAALLASPDLKDRLYHLNRIFEFPIPVKEPNNSIRKLKEGLHLNITKRGVGGKKAYYCGPDIEMNLTFAEAMDCIDFVFDSFNWDTAHPQSRDHAIARLLTPYCQGIMGFHAKSPLWIFQANRSRSGKDYCAAIAPLVFEGTAYEDAPLDKEDSENKRRITSAIIAGQKFMHFANCKINLDQCPSLEAAVTAKFWHDRIIGTSETIKMANEIIYSLSFNGPIKLSEDMANRTRRIKLFMPPGKPANSQSFFNLHGWLTDDTNRRTVIAALQALVDNWIKKGRIPGSVKFTSFPEWAAVVGGIMEAARLGNPCQPDASDTESISSSWYRDISLMAETIGKAELGVPLTTADILDKYVKKDAELAATISEYKSEESYKRELGQQLKGLDGKDLGGGLKVILDDRHGDRRPRYKFYPVGGAKPAPSSSSSPANTATSAPATNGEQAATGNTVPPSVDANNSAITTGSEPAKCDTATSTLDCKPNDGVTTTATLDTKPTDTNNTAAESNAKSIDSVTSTSATDSKNEKAGKPRGSWKDQKVKPRWMSKKDYELLNPKPVTSAEGALDPHDSSSGSFDPFDL